MANKGSPFEREVCCDLSLWWSGERRDDIFYRTNASGGRATARHKRGKDTYGAYGDVGAQDPTGAPFLEVMVLELKRGYPQGRISDLIDRGPASKRPLYDEWVCQAENSCKQAGSYGWGIIHRRDRQIAVITIPQRVYKALINQGVHCSSWTPWFSIFAVVNGDKQMLFGTTLHQFCKSVAPEAIRHIAAGM